MNKGLSRRNLFKYMGAGGAATVAAACDQKPEKLIPMLVPPTNFCLLYTSPSPRDRQKSRMPSSA